MTNFEKVQKLSIEEMAMAIMCPYELMVEVCIPVAEGEEKPCKRYANCKDCCLSWLRSEAVE